MSEIDRLIRELEESAAKLRAGGLDDAQAAATVERCAELAARVSEELERHAREARADADPGQESLL